MAAQDEVNKQIKAGISKAEIEANLIERGFDKDEVTAALAAVREPVQMDYSKSENASLFTPRNILSVLLIIFLLVRLIMRMSR